MQIFKLFSSSNHPQSSETDWNRDGKLDSLSLKLEMPLRANENVYSVDLFLFFDVKLHVSCVSSHVLQGGFSACGHWIAHRKSKETKL